MDRHLELSATDLQVSSPTVAMFAKMGVGKYAQRSTYLKDALFIHQYSMPATRHRALPSSRHLDYFLGFDIRMPTLDQR